MTNNNSSLNTMTALAVISLLLSGCAAAGKNYNKPAFDFPGLWHASDAKTLPDQVSKETRHSVEKSGPWWNSFHDDTLSVLIEKALANNQNRKIAEARILETRASRQSTASALYPQVGINGTASRGNVVTQAPASLYQAGFDASYEVDLFGGNRRGVEAADAGIQASESEQQLYEINSDLVASEAKISQYMIALYKALAMNRIGHERHFTVILAFGLGDAGFNGQVGLRQGRVHTKLDGFTAGHGSTAAVLEFKQAFKNPQGRLGGVKVER